VSNPTSISIAGRTVVVAGRTALAVSVNGGANWTAPPAHGLCAGHQFGVSRPRRQYLVAARDGLFRSSDAGDSWARVSFALSGQHFLRSSLMMRNRRILATGGDSTNIFETTDNGRTWTPIHSNWQVRNLISSMATC